MTRCPECGAVLDSMSELARHECEPTHPTPEEVKRIRTAMHKHEDAERNARMLARAQREFEGA
jgi:hypothetical protein